MEKLCASIIIVSFLLYWFKIRMHVPKGYKLPPGPPRRFLIGNLLDIPLKKEWKTYNKWFKTYGELTYLKIFGTSILFVNSDKLASELFDQRGALYSNRYQSTTLVDLVSFDWSVALMQPNEEWKKHRSILHQHLSKTALVQRRQSFEKFSKVLLHRLHQTPEKFLEHTRHVIGSFIMELTYGITTLPDNDPYIELAERALSLFGELTVPGANLVDIFPILKHTPSWFPGAGFVHKAKRLSSQSLFNLEKKLGKAPPSIVGNYLEEIDCNGSESIHDEKTIKEIGAIIYIGAIDTTESVLQIFFMAMLLYPDVQKKAQDELDAVIGKDSMASFDDRQSLPYIEALIKEVLRWHPVTPIAFPHLLKEDDTIGEYYVPKGTIVVGNTWSILHSELTYGDDVDVFRPERFLKPDVKYPDNAYGFGRRVCAGRQLADNLLFIMIANVLQMFEISPYEGPTGPELPDADDFVPGIISRPKPFKLKLTPRSPETESFLEQLSG